MMLSTNQNASSRLDEILILLGPLALIGRIFEWPFLTLMHKASHIKEKLISAGLIFLLLLGSFKPVYADFIGFDLIPLSGSLLMDIRDFYITYQKQIMAIKKAALAYYTVRQLDVNKIAHELGDLAELEVTEAARAYSNKKVEGYVTALTWTGEENNTQNSGLTPSQHDGHMGRGVRFLITGNDGTNQYKTASEVWNVLFNPYDPDWNPALTQETWLVLRAQQRWLRRELVRYRRAVQTWEKLAAVYDGIELEGIGTVSTSQAISWAIKSTVSLDKDAANLNSRVQGSIQKYVTSRLTYWKSRINDVQMTLDSIGQAVANINKDMPVMERRALTMIEARIRLRSRELWNVNLPGPGRNVAIKSKVKNFSKGWGRS